jgi:deoxyribodipyrimidine photo-lyase
MLNIKRIRQLNKASINNGPIIYWMSRDQRIQDNWALLYAQELAIDHKQPLVVVFCLVPNYLGATIRQYDFMIDGLIEIEQKLAEINIPFFVLIGEPEISIQEFIHRYKIGAVVMDFSPLRINRKWKAKIEKVVSVPIYEIDTHNIVPCWLASHKQEYSAYTFRRKINALLSEFLDNFPDVKRHPYKWNKATSSVDWGKEIKTLNIDRSVSKLTWIKPGENEAHKALDYFIDNKLNDYDLQRNDPTKDGQSNLSPYIHFGQISAQRIALEILRSDKKKESCEAFLEELIVRRELSDNFCYYNDFYDSFDGFPKWAKDTLNQHRNDKREYLYSMSQFENAQTHDNLWNISQLQIVKYGKMHGYMRMYWAKKILEWTKSPEEALDLAIYLNDKYELDGRDPNGYVGIAWSIGGVHDRAWSERSVFGKIRYMSYNGCRSKFDVDEYINKWKS